MVTEAAIKEKSEQLHRTCRELTAEYMCEELLRVIGESQFAAHLWLENDRMLKEGLFPEKGEIKLDFRYVTAAQSCQQNTAAPGQKLSLKLAYVLLLALVKKQEDCGIVWRGNTALTEYGAEYEIQGQLGESGAAFHLYLKECTAQEAGTPQKRKHRFVMQEDRELVYLRCSQEPILAKHLYRILQNPFQSFQPRIYGAVYDILAHESINGRHMRENLAKLCAEGQITPEEKSAQQIFAFAEDADKTAEWERYIGKMPLGSGMWVSWQDVIEKIEKFLSGIWGAVCRDEVFFGDWMPELERFLD